MIDFANSPLWAQPLYGGADAHFKGFFSTLQGRVLKKEGLRLKKAVFQRKNGQTRLFGRLIPLGGVVLQRRRSLTIWAIGFG